MDVNGGVVRADSNQSSSDKNMGDVRAPSWPPTTRYSDVPPYSMTSRSDTGDREQHRQIPVRDIRAASWPPTTQYSDVLSHGMTSRSDTGDREQPLQIPVRVNVRSTNSRSPETRTSNNTENVTSASDDDFSIYVRKKTNRYFIGGFLQSLNENIILTYAKRRGVKLSMVTIFRPQRMETAIIRVNAEPENGDTMLADDFWPSGVTCQIWVNRSARHSKYGKTRAADTRDQRSDGDHWYGYQTYGQQWT